MTLRFLFFGFCFLGIGILSAQDDDLPIKYREDQFYVSFALQLQQQDISGFKQNGFSNNFQIGFIRDIPINTKGTFAIGLGVGYDYNRLVSNLNLSEIESKMKFSLTENQKNLQTFSSIVFPLSIRLRSSTPYRTDFWRVYGGLKYRLLLSSR
ncbi:MAG: outer membrane beta-barrel protein, partial [Bacteroidetes bacterium]|nr:outer membrane beta-barrel protein [Bacteroidota bacterium]